MSIAVHCPIKPPHHPIASGDRLIARNLMTALDRAGFAPRLATDFIAYSKRADTTILAERKAAALAEADAAIERLRADPPAAMLTYHPYCKAPDWIGPRIADAFSIPYVTVEAARTGQGREDGGDVWAAWRAEAQAGMRRADLHFVIKPSDRAMLLDLLGPYAPLADFPPFIDTDLSFPARTDAQGPTRLLSVGQFRPGKKVENHRHLAAALSQLANHDWHLTLIGGGPAQAEIEAMFAHFPAKQIRFTGELPHEGVLAEMARADVFVWPGWREPIGMVYLEAQLAGLSVVAFADGGVPLVVRDGLTGLLTPPDDDDRFAAAIGRLIRDTELRRRLATAARPAVLAHHSLDRAARDLTAGFARLGVAPNGR